MFWISFLAFDADEAAAADGWAGVVIISMRIDPDWGGGRWEGRRLKAEGRRGRSVLRRGRLLGFWCWRSGDRFGERQRAAAVRDAGARW